MNYNKLLNSINLSKITKDNLIYFYKLANLFLNVFKEKMENKRNIDFVLDFSLNERAAFLQAYSNLFEFHHDVVNLINSEKIVYDPYYDDDLDGRYEYNIKNPNDFRIILKDSNKISNVIVGIHELSHLYDDMNFKNCDINKDFFSEMFAFQSQNSCLLDLYNNIPLLRDDLRLFYNKSYFELALNTDYLLSIIEALIIYYENNNLNEELFYKYFKNDDFDYIKQDMKLLEEDSSCFDVEKNITYLLASIYGIILTMENVKDTYKLRNKYFTNDINKVLPKNDFLYVKEVLEDFNKKVLKK